MKIVIASDSFKGSLTSADVADAAERGIRAALDNTPLDIIKLSVADGGEGTAAAVATATGGRMVTATATDPLGRPIEASYALIPGEGGNSIAVIDVAAASGLPLLAKEERDPLKTSSFGTGELILDALDSGCREFIIGLGGSATNDGGMGMLTALGVRFSDASGRELSGRGCDLEAVRNIDLSGMVPALKEARFTVACDVDTPFCGPQGAAAVFAPQKGATARDVERLEQGMKNFAGVIRERLSTDIGDMPGAGAAGGLGGAFKAFLGANLRKGTDIVLDIIGFDKLLEGADLVITGEGRADFQTPKGKTAAGVLARAKAAGVPVILIAGKIEHCPELDAMGFKALLRTAPEDMPIATAINPAVAKQNIIGTLSAYFSRDKE